MDTKAIIAQVNEKLEKYSVEVQSNLKKLIAHFNDESNLSDIEKTATQISFWRSMDDKSCSAMIEKIENEEHHELASEFNRFAIFSNWLDCISWDEFFQYTNEDEALSNELEIELEVCYIQWFIKNWIAIKGPTAKRLEYFLIENNSVRNFDLQRYNFTDMYPNHQGPQREKPYYSHRLSDHAIRQRVLMDMVDHTYLEPLVRILKKEKNTIKFWYSECQLIITDNSDGQNPLTLFSEKRAPSENKYQAKA